jgi:DNA-binding NarL/FixJ family response regulator
MSGKRPNSVEISSKFKRKIIPLSVKLEVIERYERGERAVDIGRALGLSESTLRTIRANSNKIREC